MKDDGNKPVLGDPLDSMTYPTQSSKQPASAPGHDGGAQQDAEPPTQPQDHKESDHRDKDSGLGLPDFEPTAQERQRMTTVSKEDVEMMRREQEDIESEFEKKFQELQQAGLMIPQFVYSFALWTIVFIGAVLGLFIVNQGITFFVSISALNTPWNIIAATIVIILLALILVVVFKIFKYFIIFRKNTKIDLKALNVLNERGRLRNQAGKKNDEARRLLTTYLKEHPLEDCPPIRLGLDTKEFANLKKQKQNLLGNKAYIDSAQWLNEFDSSVISLLDTAARRRIRVYVKSVAVGTAASPIKFIDQMIVLYASFNLISEMMRIYNLKPAFGQSATILARSVIHAYLSGLVGEHIESGLESVTQSLESVQAELGMSGSASVGSGLLGAIAPKIAEGGLNGLLVWRLGSQARKMLRPL